MRKRRRRFVAKNMSYTLRRLGILIIIPLLLAGSVWGIIALVKNGGSLSTADALPFLSKDKYEFTGSGFLYLKDGSLYYNDLTDKKKDYTFLVNAADVNIAASSAICALFNSNAIQIVGADSSIEERGRVLNVKCGLDYVAVLCESQSGASILKVFDSKASQIDEISADSEFSSIMDFGFTGTGSNMLWTLIMDTSSEIPVSTITTYDLAKKSTTGIMTVQRQLVESLEFTQNSIFAIGTNDLMRYNNGSLVYRLLLYGYEATDFSANSGKPMFLLQPRNADGQGLTVKLCTVAEKEVADESIVTLQLPRGTLSAFLAGGRLVACTPTTLYTYSSTGSLISETKLKNAVDGVGAIKLTDTEILLCRGENLYRTPLK